MSRDYLQRALLLCGALATVGGCRSSLNFYQCDALSIDPMTGNNADCDQLFPAEAAQGIHRQCTSDHLCIDHFCNTLATYTPAAPPTASVTIGALLRLDLVNNEPPKDQARLDAIGFAFSELTDTNSGELNDVAVQLLACNTGNGNDAARAALAFQEAVNEDHAVAIIGPSSSDEIVDSGGVGRLVGQSGALVISPSATYPGLTTKFDDKGLLWSTAPSDVYQAKALAHLFPVSTTTVDYILYTSSAYASGLAGAVVAERTMQRDGSAAIKQFQYTEGDEVELATQIANMVTANPPYVVYVADADVPIFLADIAMQFQNGKLTTTKFFLTDSAHQQALYAQLPSALLANIEGTAPQTASTTDFSTGIENFCNQTSSVTAQYPCPSDISLSSYPPNAYDAFYLAALGIRVAIGLTGSPTRHSVTGSQAASVLLNISDTTKLVGPKLNAEGALDMYATTLIGKMTVNVDGVSGPLDYDSTRELAPENIVHWKIIPGVGGADPTFDDSQQLTPTGYQLP